jgi:hypothetical protein
MQELQQTESRGRPRAKSFWVPLGLLIIPTVTFLTFLLSGFAVYLSRRWPVSSSPQPVWLHFCVTHTALLPKLFLIGLLCSGLNSLVTILWFRKERWSAGAQSYLGEIAPQSLFLGGGFLLVTLLTAMAYLYKTLCRLRIVNPQGVLSGLIINDLLPIGALIFFLGLILLVATTSLFSVVEFFSRLKTPAPRL